MIKRLMLGLALASVFVAPGTGATQLDIAATTTSMAMVVREVGGNRVSVTTLSPPDRDTHYLTARPGMIRDLRGADMVVAVGAELEVGWLPAAIRNAANPAINPGRAGYFEAAAQVELRGAGRPADRSRGDVHPAGNPHVQLDPIRLGEVAGALATRLGQLDAQGADHYRDNAEAFAERMARQLDRWRAETQDAPGALLYHKDMDYLMVRLEVPILGYIEPLPGVPPTARHVRALVDELDGRDGVILHRPFDSADAVRRLSDTLGWKATGLPLDPPLGADADAYIRLIDRYAQALARD